MQTLLFWSSFLLLILNHCPFLNGAPSISPCPDNNLNITGGIYTLSKVNNHETILRYICEEGFYPSVKKRVCSRGQWNPKPTKRLPVCKKVTCPNPNVENGNVLPLKRSYIVNDTTTYQCYSDFTFRGSATRVCQSNGKWSGGTPICSHNNNHCPDPGIPPGMTNREGHIFDIDDKVTYTCQKDLTLIGSKVRVCLDSGYWSGKEPECYADFTYDTPEEVAEAFSSSLKTTITMHEESEQAGKKIRLDQNGKLDIYIALDASDSIDEDNFNKAKNVIKKLINKISYYEVFPNYDILIFATDVQHIVNMTDFKRKKSKLSDVFTLLDNYNFEQDRKKTGTNIHKAYESIRDSISFEKENNKKDFPVTQHVVIMFTDGIANMGGDPKPVVDEIRQTVQDGNKDRETYLDLYVFGVGDDVEKDIINEWVTKRYNEKYFFMLQDIQKVEETLDEMIDESTIMPLCGLYKDYTEDRFSYPWMISISVLHQNGARSNCVGSLVTPMFILTAAHCFKFGDEPKNIQLLASNSNAKSLGTKVEKFFLHRSYNITGKKAQNINESYEYDVALIQLETPVKINPDLRTICIPCTVETNRALQLSDNTPCVKQREMLFNSDLVKANFIKHELVTKKQKATKHVLIKQHDQKSDCYEQAKKVLNISEKTARLMITENFLCTGGVTKNFVDAITCKGDSGGPIFLEVNRLIQVGVISWGLKDICLNGDKQTQDARDFHIDLFDQKVQDFLVQYLGNEDIDTPLHFL
ncbi:complement factor B-like isoform X1 [Tachysurus fulvidraco]|uniref:complement factor B-like isoform X1 n=1 Tax=Tachysurus fulvidraco TaxID=1234273 RepID=UPI000F4DFA0B|nr:complement factor B-like isoform X1 [Tachysurus fulvidraco]